MEEKGVAHQNRNDGIFRHTAWGLGTSGGGWQVAGEDDTQVGGALHWKRNWGAGERIGL